MTLVFERVSHAPLTQVSADLGPGEHVVLGSDRDGTGTFVALAAGLVGPATGRVTLGAGSPFESPALRGRVGALLAQESLPPGRTVQGALELALLARADRSSVLDLLDHAGLSRFAARRPSSLSAHETRALALLLALSHRTPRLLALHEPVALLSLVSESFFSAALSRCTEVGAIVLASASSEADAGRLGGATSALDRGIWLNSPHSRAPLSEVSLRVRSPEARRLAALLTLAPGVSAIECTFDTELVARGGELVALSVSIVKQARAASIRIEALRYDPPGLEAMAAARAGLAQAESERQGQVVSAAHVARHASPEQP